MINITELVQKLYNYTRLSPMSADAHTDAINKAQEIIKEYEDLQKKYFAEVAERATKEEEALQDDLDMQAPCEPPVVEVLGTEKKVVGGPEKK